MFLSSRFELHAGISNSWNIHNAKFAATVNEDIPPKFDERNDMALDRLDYKSFKSAAVHSNKMQRNKCTLPR